MQWNNISAIQKRRMTPRVKCMHVRFSLDLFPSSRSRYMYKYLEYMSILSLRKYMLPFLSRVQGVVSSSKNHDHETIKWSWLSVVSLSTVCLAVWLNLMKLSNVEVLIIPYNCCCFGQVSPTVDPRRCKYRSRRGICRNRFPLMATLPKRMHSNDP